MAELVVETISALRSEEIARVQLIYEAAFVPDLRVPFGELAEPGSDHRTFVALDGPEPVGFCTLRLLGSAQWSFLRYFAVARERRSEGIGRRFWRLLNRSLAEEAWPASIVFEVEDPGEAAVDAPEKVIRQRRVDFWTACGARLLPAAGYVMPDYTGSGRTEPMLLMAATSATAPRIEGDQLRSLILAIYADHYGLSATDPLVVRALV